MSFDRDVKRYQDKLDQYNTDIADLQRELGRANEPLKGGNLFSIPLDEYMAITKNIEILENHIERVKRMRDIHIKSEPKIVYPPSITAKVKALRKLAKEEQKYVIPPSSQFVGSPYGDYVIQSAPDDPYGPMPMDLGFAFRRKSKRKSGSKRKSKRKSPARKRKSPARKRKSSRRRSRARK